MEWQRKKSAHYLNGQVRAAEDVGMLRRFAWIRSTVLTSSNLASCLLITSWLYGFLIYGPPCPFIASHAADSVTESYNLYGDSHSKASPSSAARPRNWGFWDPISLDTDNARFVGQICCVPFCSIRFKSSKLVWLNWDARGHWAETKRRSKTQSS